MNEQQRPGDLILVPKKYRATDKEEVHWEPKLIRKMELRGAGNNSSVRCEGLLLYSGKYIREKSLDRQSLVPETLKRPNVLFATNHLDKAESTSGMVSSMRGTPVATVRFASDPSPHPSAP